MKSREPAYDPERIIWMRLELGLFYTEIAKRLHMSKHTVRKVLYKAGAYGDKSNGMLNKNDPGILGECKPIRVPDNDPLLEALRRHHV